MKSRYLGERTPELLARLAVAAELKAAAEDRRRTVARPVRMLRVEGFMATDRETGSLLMAFTRAGVFRLGGALIGTAAYALFQGELGIRFDSEDLAQTGDIDRFEEEPGDILRSLEFDPVPGLQDRQVWKCRQTRGAAMVEFLTPAFGAEEVTPLPASAVSAQGLNFLDYLIADPIPALALYRSGVLVQIPRPERFALHKLIIADRRRDRLKARKDRAQAAHLVAILAQDRPDDLHDALEDARARGPRWRARIEASLARLPETAAILSDLR